MIVVAYQRTMAGAKRLIDETPKKPTPRRDRLVAFCRTQEQARALVRKKKEALEQRRQNLVKRSTIQIPILPHTAPAEIIAMVSFWSGISMQDILSMSRAYPVVEARFDAMAAVAVNCRINNRKLRLTDIGRVFGRDHSTILCALRQRGLHD